MAFKVRKLSFRRWPVTITLRDCQDDGSVADVDARFIAHWKPFTEPELLALREQIFGAGTDEELAKAAAERTLAEQAYAEASFYGELLVGWEGVTGDDGAPIPYNTTELERLMIGPDGPAIRRGLTNALMEIRFGLAPLKNALTSPAAGQTPAAGEAATS